MADIKTRPVGEIFHLVEEKVFLQVVSDNGMNTCKGCFFKENREKLPPGNSCLEGYTDNISESRGHCGHNWRDDNQDVIFKKVEPQMELEPCFGCHKDNCNGCIVFNQDHLEQEKIIIKEKSLEEQVSFLVGLLTERQLDEFTSFLNNKNYGTTE